MRSPWSYLILLATGLAIGSAGSESVELTLYGESLCPFCKNWILEEAVPLFQQGFDEYIHLRYVAWGNAHVREVGGLWRIGRAFDLRADVLAVSLSGRHRCEHDNYVP